MHAGSVRPVNVAAVDRVPGEAVPRRGVAGGKKYRAPAPPIHHTCRYTITSAPLLGLVLTKEEKPVVKRTEIVRIPVELPLLRQPLGLAPVDVRLDRGLACGDEAGVPGRQPSQRYESCGGHEGFVEDKRAPRKNTKALAWIASSQLHVPCPAPPVVRKLLHKYFKAEHHDESTASNGEDHVKEKVAMVEVANAVVKPGAVMIHLEHAGVAHAAVVGPGWLRRNAFLADGRHSFQLLVGGWVAR